MGWYMHKQILLLVLAVAFAGSVHGREIAGVHVDETVVVPGVAETLKLNGAAIRSKFLVKVYVAALYVTETTDDASVILASTSARRMMLHMLYNEVEKEKLAKSWQEGVEKNLGAADYLAIKSRLDRFNSLFSTMRRNDVAWIDYVPGAGTRVTLRGKGGLYEEKGVIEGADFYRAILSVWIGDEPATEEMKAGLLGIDK
ncbi:MAG: hypothetical protein QG652_1482 [Pseudomonadota bacterium]|nr:hypothetical protein [Pseudomonadota bacterium]